MMLPEEKSGKEKEIDEQKGQAKCEKQKRKMKRQEGMVTKYDCLFAERNQNSKMRNWYGERH